MSGRHYLGLCAIAKDETPFLREWVAYHHLIGFERIIVYDNESEVPAREVLADMIDAGWAETYFIAGKAMQLTAYHHCLATHGAEFDWLAFFDLDEFLLLHKEQDARALLCGYEDFAGLGVNFAMFSSSGRLGRPEGLCLENYTEFLEFQVHVKCFVRPETVKLVLSPHDFLLKEGFFAVDTDRIPLYKGFAPVTADQAQLNHYSYRSQQDFEDKLRRGDAIYLMNSPRTRERFYEQAARPVTTDTRIMRHADRVRALMAGTGCPYIALDSAAVRSEPLVAALARLARDLEEGRPERARLTFLLNRERFQDKASYLTLGIRACMEAGDWTTAESAAKKLLAVAPALSSYSLLLSLYLASGRHGPARKLAAFLLWNAQQEHNSELEASVCQAMAEYGLSLEGEAGQRLQP